MEWRSRRQVRRRVREYEQTSSWDGEVGLVRG
jgi:hypothetical protein